MRKCIECWESLRKGEPGFVEVHGSIRVIRQAGTHCLSKIKQKGSWKFMEWILKPKGMIRFFITGTVLLLLMMSTPGLASAADAAGYDLRQRPGPQYAGRLRLPRGTADLAPGQ